MATEKEREAFKPNIPHTWICWTSQTQYKTPPFLYYGHSCAERHQPPTCGWFRCCWLS